MNNQTWKVIYAEDDPIEPGVYEVQIEELEIQSGEYDDYVNWRFAILNNSNDRSSTGLIPSSYPQYLKCTSGR